MSADVAFSLVSLRRAIDKIVVITVESATDRHKQVSQLLNRIDLPFEFHFGRDCRNTTVDALAADGDYDPSARARLRSAPLTPGEVGCALSHRDAARNIADGPDGRVLILEDDVKLLEENVRHFETSVVTMPSEWNLAYFGYAAMNLSIPPIVHAKLLSWYPLMRMLGSERHDPTSIRRIYRRRLNSHWMHAGWFNNTHAYAIDRTAARYITDAQTPVSYEADLVLNYLVRFSGLDAICLKYPIFDQRLDIPSLIGDRPSWQDNRLIDGD